MQLHLNTLLLALLAFLTFTLAATVPQKAVIVSYPEDTPDSVMSKAKSEIRKAGGIITHEYKKLVCNEKANGVVELIKAFAAKTSEASLDSVRALGAKYNALIEEDQVVHTQNGAF